jgi:long-chain acyl-CoA synthetase
MSFDRLASDDPTAGSELPATETEPECWVFDVDGCLIDSLTGSSLRPGARDILEHLSTEGQHVILWSAGGDAYAEFRAKDVGVDHLIDGFFAKDGRDPDGYYRTEHLPAKDRHAVFVDDRPEDLARGLDVLAVSPYLSDDPYDNGLREVAWRAGLA